MSMGNFFFQGGPLMMSLISIAGLVMVCVAVYVIVQWAKGAGLTKKLVKSIPIAGSLAFMLGILAQAIGLYQAMSAIQEAGDVSPALLAGGFQVSMIAPIYGLLIFVISLIVFLCIMLFHSQEEASQ